jgi:YHS domain-containing protein
MYKAVSRLLIVATGFLAVAYATPPAEISHEKPVDEIDNVKGLALKGYDPVAYFTERKPAPGRPDISYRWQGASYYFASTADRALFAANPGHYAPQFGGYCAYAVSRGTTAEGDPLQWTVDDDRLFVNNNFLAQWLWNRHRTANIKQGRVNWPLIPKRRVAAGSAAGAGVASTP